MKLFNETVTIFISQVLNLKTKEKEMLLEA